MNRSIRILRNGLGLLLLLALAAAAAWVIVQSRPRPPQAAGSPLPTPTVRSPQPPSPPPSATAQPPSPTPAATRVGQRVPYCTFPGGEPPDKGGPGLDQYEFSEPRVVLTSTGSLFIADWLPDNQRLLLSMITRSADMPPGTVQVGTFDVRSEKLIIYGRSPGRTEPFWLPQSQAVAYVVLEWENEAQGLWRKDLWVSQGDASQAQRVVTGLDAQDRKNLPIWVDRNGYLIHFTKPNQQPPQVPEAARRFLQVQAVPFAQTDWVYPKYPMPQYMDQYLNVARRPGGSQIALYSDPYLFLYSPGSAEVCEIDLGRGLEDLPVLPVEVSWSPNGRRLAMLTTARLPGALVRYMNLVILDLNTGELVRPQLPPKVWEIAWAPNSQQVLALADIQPSQLPIGDQLFLVDALTGVFRLMLPEYTFSRERMAWAPDGKSLAVRCPTVTDLPNGGGRMISEDRICLITTETHP